MAIKKITKLPIDIGSLNIEEIDLHKSLNDSLVTESDNKHNKINKITSLPFELNSIEVSEKNLSESFSKSTLTEAKRYVRRYYIRPQDIFCSNKAEILKALIEIDKKGGNCTVYTLNNLGDIKDTGKLTNDDIIYYYDDGILYDKNKLKVMDYDLYIKHEEDRDKINVNQVSDRKFNDVYDDRMTDQTVVESVARKHRRKLTEKIKDDNIDLSVFDKFIGQEFIAYNVNNPEVVIVSGLITRFEKFNDQIWACVGNKSMSLDASLRQGLSKLVDPVMNAELLEMINNLTTFEDSEKIKTAAERRAEEEKARAQQMLKDAEERKAREASLNAAHEASLANIVTAAQQAVDKDLANDNQEQLTRHRKRLDSLINNSRFHGYDLAIKLEIEYEQEFIEKYKELRKEAMKARRLDRVQTKAATKMTNLTGGVSDIIKTYDKIDLVKDWLLNNVQDIKFTLPDVTVTQNPSTKVRIEAIHNSLLNTYGQIFDDHLTIVNKGDDPYENLWNLCGYVVFHVKKPGVPNDRTVTYADCPTEVRDLIARCVALSQAKMGNRVDTDNQAKLPAETDHIISNVNFAFAVLDLFDNELEFYKYTDIEDTEDEDIEEAFSLDFEDIDAYGHKLHEGKEIDGVCCICGEPFEGYGNNPEPYKHDGRCCDGCNLKFVIPARLEQMNNKKGE